MTTTPVGAGADLSAQGLTPAGRVIRNPTTSMLYEHALKRGDGRIAEGGPLAVDTGVHTGRSPKDKFVVREPGSEGRIWWGAVNQPIEPDRFEGLRGKVVLVRWFNTNCRYCGNTLPGLETLRKRYASQGLVVVGVFHPKPARAVSDAFVRRTARKLGFMGPLAVDEQWTTLNRWWLANHPDRNWTSVSFLIDREGVVRWAQGGGEYHVSSDPRHAACDASYATLERTIRALLEDRAANR